jgi:hypothetical protein
MTMRNGHSGLRRTTFPYGSLPQAWSVIRAGGAEDAGAHAEARPMA